MKDPQDILAAVQEIASQPDAYPEGRYLLEIVETAVNLIKDRPERGDLKMVNQAFRELREAFSVFQHYRRIRKVSVFGSARTPETAAEYHNARDFANRMTKSGWMVITGAGPGIMAAAQTGAGRSRSFGVNIRLPFEQRANKEIDNDPKLVLFKYFFTRKVVFVKETDAIALFPGGFGTHDEAFESITLVQTGKSQLLPIVCIDREDGSYWAEWRKYVETHLLGGGYIGEHDLNLVQVVNNIDDAADIIDRFYWSYHSARIVNGRMILRLKTPVEDELLQRLNDEFSDILTKGKIEHAECHRWEERDEPETVRLHRLGMWFDRRSFGRLRAMVDLLNDSAKGQPVSPTART